MQNETLETRSARLTQRARFHRYISDQVWGPIAPAAVLHVAASALVRRLTDTSGSLPPMYPEGLGLTEEDLQVWASDWSFRPLPDGSWVLVTIPDQAGEPWVPLAHIAAPADQGCGSLPEITWL